MTLSVDPKFIQPIRHSTHAAKTWQPVPNYAFAAQALAAPLAIAELAHASSSYALAVLDGEQPALVALLGLGGQKNLFVGPDGQWLGDYVPAIFRGYPFKLLPSGEQYALGYDEASGLLAGAGEAEPFFSESGEPTERIRATLNFLIGVQRGQQAASAAVQSLKQAGVLEPWPLKLRDGDNEIAVAGLLRINESALADLDDSAFLLLRANAALTVAYAQLLSMSNISKLGRLAQAHAQHQTMVQKRQEEIHSMFEPLKVDDEIDWDAMLKDD